MSQSTLEAVATASSCLSWTSASSSCPFTPVRSRTSSAKTRVAVSGWKCLMTLIQVDMRMDKTAMLSGHPWGTEQALSLGVPTPEA
eukprot:5151276-Alexandrium_andersonii.AAC.1